MTSVTILGLDPGLRQTGYALAAVSTSTGNIDEVLDVGIIETRRTHLRAVRKTSDDLRRAKETALGLRRILNSMPVDVIAAEMATTTPYTYPTFSFGVMVGILASLGRPIIEVLPYEVKRAATGHDRASKRDIIAWAIELPASQNVAWPISPRSNKLDLRRGGGFVSNAAEHPADALAVIQAAVQTDQFRLANDLIG